MNVKRILSSFALLIVVFIMTALLFSCTPPGNVDPPSGTKSFWSTNLTKDAMADSSAWYQLNATLNKEGTHCIVYIEEGSTVSQSAIDGIVMEFDSAIWNVITNDFGSPTDIDANQKIVLLLLDVKDGYSPPGNTSYVAGFFYGIDLFSNTELQSLGYPSYCKSNEMELLYIDVNPNDPTTIDFKSTIAHEFQHLVNMSRNVFAEGGNNTPVWINEGFSMAAETIYRDIPILTDRENWYDLDPLYSGAVPGIPQDLSRSITNGFPFVIWNPYPDYPYTVLNNYSLSHLFFAWLKIQMGTNSFLKTILDSPDNTIQSVVSVCSATLGTNVDTYPKMLGRWWMANLLGGNGKTTGLESYKGLNTHSGPSRFNGAGGTISLYASGALHFINPLYNNWAPSGGDAQIGYELGNVSSMTADYTASFGTGSSYECMIVYNTDSGGIALRTSAVLPKIEIAKSIGQPMKVNGMVVKAKLQLPKTAFMRGRDTSDAILTVPDNQ